MMISEEDARDLMSAGEAREIGVLEDAERDEDTKEPSGRREP